jgi:hypothetical protein
MTLSFEKRNLKQLYIKMLEDKALMTEPKTE